MRIRSVLPSFGLLFVVACSGGSDGDDVGVAVDATAADAAARDAVTSPDTGLADAGPREDAAPGLDAPAADAVAPDADPVDAGEADAAPVFPDAAPVFPDAAPVFPDAAPVFPDAAPGLPDAEPGLPDADPMDAGEADAAPMFPDAAAPVDAGPSSVSFSDVYNFIIVPRCSCHQFGSGGLTMDTESAAFQNLVSTVADGCAPQVRVIPGDVNNSLLYQKVAGTPVCGSQMPLGSGALSAADVALISDWIQQGALP